MRFAICVTPMILRCTWPISCSYVWLSTQASVIFFLPDVRISVQSIDHHAQALRLGFSDFLPMPQTRSNRYDCSERSMPR